MISRTLQKSIFKIIFSIWIVESGMRSMGVNVILSILLAIGINGALSYATLPVSYCLKQFFGARLV